MSSLLNIAHILVGGFGSKTAKVELCQFILYENLHSPRETLGMNLISRGQLSASVHGGHFETSIWRKEVKAILACAASIIP